jgi:hypothetical protein
MGSNPSTTKKKKKKKEYGKFLRMSVKEET